MVALQAKNNRRYFSPRLNSVGVYLSFVLFTLIVLLPIYWMVRSSISNHN